MRIAPAARPTLFATFVLSLIHAALGGPAAFAQQASGRAVVSVLVTDNVLARRPVMVSAISDGAIVAQQEILTDAAPNQSSANLGPVPAGACDIRVEGDGVVTEVKRGVQIFPDRNASVRAVVRPGTGIHVVEYAVGGLAREEVAARLGRLEAATAALRGAPAMVCGSWSCSGLPTQPVWRFRYVTCLPERASGTRSSIGSSLLVHQSKLEGATAADARDRRQADRQHQNVHWPESTVHPGQAPLSYKGGNQ